MTEKARWLVAVEGSPAAVARVEELIRADPSTTWAVERDGDDLWLSSPMLDGLDVGAVVAKGRHQMSILNGLARVQWAGSELVRAGVACLVREDGSRQLHVTGEANIVLAGSSVVATATVTYADGSVAVPPPPPPLLDSIFRESTEPADATLARALQLFAAPEHDWGSLYRVFEVIQAARPAELKTWATKGERDRFCQSANHPAAGGPTARHAIYKGTPAGPHATVDEGRAFIRRLLMLWVDERRAQLTAAGGG